MNALLSLAQQKRNLEPEERCGRPLTLFDLINALCEETDDDALVAAAVIDLFQRGYVRFQDEESDLIALG